MIAGCVLHELEPRFPRLLSSMPEPPATLDALQQLATGLLKESLINIPDSGQTEAAQQEERNSVSPDQIPVLHVRI